MSDSGSGEARDVFVSFAHFDDVPLDADRPGWVTEFHRHFQTRLNALLGREARVWRDPALQGNDVLLPAIRRQLASVKALVSVLSPRYVNSAWCRTEMATFREMATAAGGMQVEDQSRWFKVLKTPVERADFPADFPAELAAEIENVLGYAFFDVDPQSKRPREYSREFGAEAERLYHQKVYDLAWDVHRLLKRLENVPASVSASPTAVAAAPGAPAGKTVYLAATTADLASERDRIRRELLERGHDVLGDGTLPWVAGEVRERVRAWLRECDVSVHLMGALYGAVPEGTGDSIVAIQNSVAAEVAKEGRLKRILHVPGDLAGCEERQAAYLKALRNSESGLAGAELLEGSMERVKELLLNWLRPPTPEPAIEKRSGASATQRPPLVYLIGDPADSDGLDRIDDYLFERGLEVTRPTSSGSPDEQARVHRRRLVECDAAMIYYGSPSRDWVDIGLMDLEQARGYGREKEYRARAVCVAPPDDRAKQRFRTRAADVLRFDGRDPSTLESFAGRLLGNPEPSLG